VVTWFFQHPGYLLGIAFTLIPAFGVGADVLKEIKRGVGRTPDSRKPASREHVWRVAIRYALAVFSWIAFPSMLLLRSSRVVEQNIQWFFIILSVALMSFAPVQEAVWFFARRHLMLQADAYDESVRRRLWWSWLMTFLGALFSSLLRLELTGFKQPWVWSLPGGLLPAGALWLRCRPALVKEQQGVGFP